MPSHLSYGTSHAHHDRLGLIMAGGYDAVGTGLSTAIATLDAVFFETLENCPSTDARRGCMAILNGTTPYLVEGYNHEVYKYDMETAAWDLLGQPSHGYLPDPGCGIAMNVHGQMEFVIAGTTDESTVAADIYNIDTGEWRTSCE